jgi:hypothetical protein
MSRGRVAEFVAVSTLATIVTMVIAAPVLRALSERVFGMEIVGRLTVMEQFGVGLASIRIHCGLSTITELQDGRNY